jgi:hypothetical protein
VAGANEIRIGMTSHDRSLTSPFRERESMLECMPMRESAIFTFSHSQCAGGWYSVRSTHKSCMRNLMRDVLEIIPKWSLNWISLCAKLLTLFFQIMDQKFPVFIS